MDMSIRIVNEEEIRKILIITVIASVILLMGLMAIAYGQSNFDDSNRTRTGDSNVIVIPGEEDE